MGYIRIEIKTFSKEQSEILIAQLSEIEFYAFEENENSLSAYIKENKFDEKKLNGVLSSQNISYIKSIIPDVNWNAKWESEFEPIVIENFVTVRAAFHKPVPRTPHEIIITPKMSFGTGHHATTYLMLLQMQYINFTDRSVLDFGTGTGILAILAKKLGAKTVTAIDNDEWSINNAKENFLANSCVDIDLLKKNDLDNLEKFDIILCNITLNIIIANSKRLRHISHPSTILLLSGVLQSDKKLLIDTFRVEDFICEATAHKDGWLAMLLTNI